MKQSRPSGAAPPTNGLGNHAAEGRRGVRANRDRNGASMAGNGHTQAALPGNTASVLQAREMTDLLMSLMRELFAVDDQAAELPLRQLRVCAMLYEDPRSMSSLSRELGVSLSAMTQIADRLERARLVKRSFEGTDRRVRCLQLTPRAVRIMQLRENSRVQRASAALEQLAPQQRAGVLATLQALHNACSPTVSNGNGSNGSTSNEKNGSTTHRSRSNGLKGNGYSGGKL
jgi:DNA-binding MarR family transcriptional regulator